MSKVPTIRLKYSYLIGNTESKVLAEKFGHKLRDDDYYYSRTLEYREAWQQYEKQILTGMQEALGVEFYLPTIDAHGAPYFIPKSDPLLFNYVDDPDRFVDVLTHELCHVLLNDNTSYRNYDVVFEELIGHEWNKMYNLDDFSAVIHVPVHALCKYIWLDVLKQPERYERDKKAVASWYGGKSYVRSWGYVDEHGYKQILKDLKQLYAKVKQ